MLRSRYRIRFGIVEFIVVDFRCLGHNGCVRLTACGLVRLGGRRQDPTSTKKERRKVRWSSYGTDVLLGPWILHGSRRRCGRG